MFELDLTGEYPVIVFEEGTKIVSTQKTNSEEIPFAHDTFELPTSIPEMKLFSNGEFMGIVREYRGEKYYEGSAFVNDTVAGASAAVIISI
tara:strand:- start:15938 stop:16210 length:273 start_codon:yes stop_codon:yes gene_type:complete